VITRVPLTQERGGRTLNKETETKVIGVLRRGSTVLSGTIGMRIVAMNGRSEERLLMEAGGDSGWLKRGEGVSIGKGLSQGDGESNAGGKKQPITDRSCARKERQEERHEDAKLFVSRVNQVLEGSEDTSTKPQRRGKMFSWTQEGIDQGSIMLGWVNVGT